MIQKRKPLPKREREIGMRLRLIRDGLRLTQTEMAEQVGITRERLASYEDGRAPLRYDLALRICRHFIVSEKWLATGQGYTQQYLDLVSEPIPHNWKLDAPFSLTYDKLLSPLYERLAKTHAHRIDLRESESYEFLDHLFRYLIKHWLVGVKTDEHRSALLQFLIKQGFTFMDYTREHGRAPSESDLAQFSPKSYFVKDQSLKK